jgi:hypothetical protein
MLTPTILLDDIFDPAEGWPFSSREVPIRRIAARDGNPMYEVEVDGIQVNVFEQAECEDGSEGDIPTNRLVVKTWMLNVSLNNPEALLEATNENNGLPSLGLDEDGDVTVQVAVLFADDFPVDWARKQLMVAMGLVAHFTMGFIRGYNKLHEEDSAYSSEVDFDWDTAKNVASVAGEFLKAFIRE